MHNSIKLFIFFLFISSFNYSQSIQDDFEGNGTISSWVEDNCAVNVSFENPTKTGINTSNTVLRYHDTGGQYANVRFDNASSFKLTNDYVFKLKIYIPSSGITGNENNQISLKLQNGNISAPWSTQSEIIKPLTLNTWQEITFDFKNDNYINLNGDTTAPTQRTDFNRVLIQINGENNTSHVLAFIDDFFYEVTDTNEPNTDPVYDQLVWYDEFDSSGAIDNSKWFHQTKLIAGNSWANNEQQHYTNRIENSFVENGNLKIKAIRESFTDQGHQKQFTSARLNSKFSFKYGRVEVRAKLPSVAGTWPAIWLLGKNINEDGGYFDNQGFGTTSWPLCGEIDIMEPNIAKTEILATWHWDNGDGYKYNSKGIATNNNDTSNNYHIYALEWDANTMKIYMDDILINQMESVNPFNQEFYILLNVAMGGSLGGAIDNSFTSDTMEIDYIRVYQESQLSLENITKKVEAFVYPNPVKDILNLKLSNNSAIKNIQLFDFSGKLVLNTSQNKISVKNLKTGIYLLKIITDEGNIIYKKIMKQ